MNRTSSSPSFDRVIGWLLDHPLPIPVRIFAATLFVTATAIVRLVFITDLLPWLLFIPIVLLMGLAFGRSTAIYTAVLSTIMAAATLAVHGPGHALTNPQWAATILYLVIALGCGLSSAELRAAFRRARALDAERVRSAALLQQRERRLALLAHASVGLLSANDPDAVISVVLKSVAEQLGFDQSYSYTLSPDCKHLRLTHSIGVADEVKALLCDAAFDEPLCGIVAETGNPLILNDLQSSPEPRYAIARDLGLKAYAGFPVMAGSSLLGVISFASTKHLVFDDEALSFFATLARFLSVSRERLAREQELVTLAQTLETRVEERTSELLATEDALRQSQKMDAIGQLTGGVAHDFNNLLTVIRGSVDLLRRDNLPEDKRVRYIDAIGTTADRAAKLTEQLLAFARRTALKPEVFDVTDRITAISAMLDTVTGSRIAIRTVFPDAHCAVHADASRFETAIVNIAVNARDAMDGEGILTIAVEGGRPLPSIRGHAAAPGPFVAVSVSDTGSGIDADDIGRVFEPFFTTKDVGKGTGLGLSQVFGFAKQSNGDVDVTSDPGRGTTFTVYLPEVPADPVVDTAIPVREQGSMDGRGIRVLLIEDNIEVGEFATQLLRDMGYDPVWLPSAEDALDRLDTDGDSFDVVFSDVVMPGMGGIELAKRLRDIFPALPVLLSSGYSHVLAEGSCGFELLQKPYSGEGLSRGIRTVIARQRSIGADALATLSG